MNAYCALTDSFIGCIPIDANDFVDSKDESYDDSIPENERSEECSQYGCENMQASPIPSTEEILNKYAITQKQYEKIQQEIVVVLSFGECGWCV
jgi:hypothetical protein